jgi:hypothetical protein
MTFSQIEYLELWRSVVGYEGLYEVSNWGRVRSLERQIPHKHPGHFTIVPGRMRRLILKQGRYLGLTLTDGAGKKNNALVHQLVAQVFIGPRPPGLQVDHKDGDKQNNCAWNLHYVTAKANANAGNHDRNPPYGQRCATAKLSEADVIEIRRLRLEGMKYKEIAKMFNVGERCIGKIIRRERWTYGEF